MDKMFAKHLDTTLQGSMFSDGHASLEKCRHRMEPRVQRRVYVFQLSFYLVDPVPNTSSFKITKEVHS